MKRLNGRAWALPLLCSLVCLFSLPGRGAGQGNRIPVPDGPQNPTTLADQAPTAAREPSAPNPFHTLTILRAGTGQGRVTGSPSGSAFRKGTLVTLQAIPSDHSVFEGWSGSCSGSSRTCLVSLSADRTLTAVFSLKTYAIQVRSPENGIIHPSGTVKVPHGEKRRFQIIPLPGYRVSEVLVDKVSLGPVNTYTFKEVTGGHLLEAIFVKQ